MNLKASSQPVFLDEHAAAGRLSLSVSTLRQYRLKGGGPKFAKFGRAVRYPVVEIDKWGTRKLFSNTSQVA